MKIYIQSAGIEQDFNWKTGSGKGDGLGQSPSAEAIALYRGLSPFAVSCALIAAKTEEHGYCLVVRSVYIAPDVRDANDRPIYLNLYIEDLSESQLRALAVSYLNDKPQDGLHYWPEIAQHYHPEGDNFDMQWEALYASLNRIISCAPGEYTAPGEMLCETPEQLAGALTQYALSSANGVVLKVQQMKKFELKVEWAESHSSEPQSRDTMDLSSLYMAAALFILFIALGNSCQIGHREAPAANGTEAGITLKQEQ